MYTLLPNCEDAQSTIIVYQVQEHIIIMMIPIYVQEIRPRGHRKILISGCGPEDNANKRAVLKSLLNARFPTNPRVCAWLESSAINNNAL